jgi:hypothetical protein
LTKELEWEPAVLVSETSGSGFEMMERLGFVNTVEKAFLPNYEPTVNSLVAKLIKPSGSRYTIAYSSNWGETATLLGSCEL